MSALEELRRGEVGDHLLALLQQTIAAVARAGGYPPPGGRPTWDADAVLETVADFLAAHQTSRRLTDLTVHCRTEQALRARLQRTIKNFLADIGRRTPVGRLVLRFNEVLGEEPAFVRDGIHWRIEGTTVDPPGVDLERLVAVVAAVEVTIPPTWTTGDRHSPDIDRASVVRLARAAIEAADGPLSPANLALIAARRLDLDVPPISLEATGYDPAPWGSDPIDPTMAAGLTGLMAREVFVRLNDAERVAVGPYGATVDVLGDALGVSRSKAHLIKKRALSLLREELEGEPDGQAIALAVIDLARIWSEEWTNRREST